MLRLPPLLVFFVFFCVRTDSSFGGHLFVSENFLTDAMALLPCYHVMLRKGDLVALTRTIWVSERRYRFMIIVMTKGGIWGWECQSTPSSGRSCRWDSLQPIQVLPYYHHILYGYTWRYTSLYMLLCYCTTIHNITPPPTSTH